jgi:zinc protease
MFRLLTTYFFLVSFLSDAQQPVFEKKLANGFTIYVMENHDQPQVFGAVAVRAGSKNDPRDATGMAHYLEHMLFKGTTTMGTINYMEEKIWLDSITFYYDKLGQTREESKRLNIQLKINELSIKASSFAIPNEIDKMLAEIGGTNVNAYTTVESTVYHNSFPPNQLQKWMELYSHRFQQPVFRLFQSELETVYEEKNRKMDDMGTSIFEFYLKNFFKNHPYGQQTTIGETEHLKNPSLKKMYQYLETYYVPNNMALVLSGDVNHEEVFALAEEKFGTLKQKPIPEFPTFEEKEFNGKEIIRIRRTPVKAGVIGYRLPKNTNADMPVLEVISSLLSNSASSGSIDKVLNDNKIMMGGLEYMPYNDGGAAFLYFVPKFPFQRMRKAENLVVKCVTDIKDGNFTEEELIAVKTNRLKQVQLSFESNNASATNLINAFIKGVAPQDYFNDIEKIKNVSKSDIQRVARNYFGDNSLAMYSRMGFPKKDKLSKPPFKPVVPKNEVNSEYYSEWKKINSKKTKPSFIDFKAEIDSVNVNSNFYILRNKNKFNKIVTMNLAFGTGKHYLPVLEYLDNYLMLCGTSKTPINQFNQKLYALGCTFIAETSTSQFTLKLSFPEENLTEVLTLIKELLTETRNDPASLSKIKREIRTDKLMNNRSVDYWSDALNAYAVYGEKSGYIDKMSFKEMKKGGTKQLMNAVNEVWASSLKIIYTGNISNTELVSTLNSCGFNTERKQPQPLYLPEKKEHASSIVYLVNSRKARQSQINLLKVGEPYAIKNVPVSNAFNKYFGGDMSSLMFQEIREFRSLAYATSASYASPAVAGVKCLFTAYAGTQNDKTNECVDVLYNLVNDMPKHPERFGTIMSSLKEISAASRPSFRSMMSTIENWKRKGYTDDPSKFLLPNYERLSFDDLVAFYEKAIQSKSTVICIAGKLKSFDTGKLKKYGAVKKIKKRKLVR